MSIKKSDLDYSKVINSLKKKVPELAILLETEGLTEEVLIALRRHAFFVTKLNKISDVKAVQRSLAQAVENGFSFRTWKEQLIQDRPKVVDTLNRTAKNRLETVFRTNTAQAYQDGAVEKARRLEMYLRYSAILDSRTRPSHGQLHGITLPATDKFWDDHRCPLDFNCRCKLIPVSSRRGKLDKTSNKELEKQIDLFNKDGGSPASFAKNTTQDAKKIRSYLKKRAGTSGISSAKVRQLEKTSAPRFSIFAKKVLSTIEED